VINLFDWVEQLTPEQLPTVPWLLHPGVGVIDNYKFLFTLQSDAKRDGWRKRFGATHADLRRLHEVVTTGHAEPWIEIAVVSAPAYKVESKKRKR
jgi:hypothetical protein